MAGANDLGHCGMDHCGGYHIGGDYMNEAKQELFKLLREELGENLTDEELEDKFNEITANVFKLLADKHPYRYCYTARRACDDWQNCPNYKGGD